jgi:CheY-like chemotaxis protein
MSPLRILVVEDDAIIATLFEELLRMMGHQVCASVASEGDAIVAAQTLAPDLMIVDDRLNPGSGVTAMHTILQTGHVPHVYVTTNESRVRKAFPDAVIVSKPFRETDLVNGMRLALAAPPRR